MRAVWFEPFLRDDTPDVGTCMQNAAFVCFRHSKCPLYTFNKWELEYEAQNIYLHWNWDELKAEQILHQVNCQLITFIKLFICPLNKWRFNTPIDPTNMSMGSKHETK